MKTIKEYKIKSLYPPLFDEKENTIKFPLSTKILSAESQYGEIYVHVLIDTDEETTETYEFLIYTKDEEVLDTINEYIYLDSILVQGEASQSWVHAPTVYKYHTHHVFYKKVD